MERYQKEMEKTSTTQSLSAKGAQVLKAISRLNPLATIGRLAGTQITPSNGMQARNSILTDYNWPGKHKPFAHQKQTSEFLTLNRKAFCFNEQGTGKTASVIWAADYLLNLGVIRRVLVICPLSIMKSAWQQDLFKFAIHRTCDIAYGDPKQRKKVLAAGAEFVIINYDGVDIVKQEILNGGFDLLVIDEASAYKNAQTTRWKTLRDIAAQVKGMWMLTGTPAAQSPVDAFGLAKLINPDNTPKFYGQFRDQVMYKVGTYRWIPKPQAQSIVHKVLQPAIRFEKDQCLDLPDVTFVERDAPLTSQQIKYYKLLKKQMLIHADGEQVSSVNAAVNINKLLQISGGAVYTDTKEVIEFDVSNRLKVIEEVINEASHKVLVFVPFTHTIELLNKYLTAANIPCAIINGQVPVNRRHDIINDFQSTENIRVLIIQPQAASHGLTLTAANVIIWYAPVTSVETYLQANARINRPGQKNPMTIVHIKGSEVEARLYRMLQNNIDSHTKIIDLYRQEIEEIA
jgi:superfamily II DNA or RNA helicase